MTQAERRHDRLAVRLSLIISRLVAGETLNMARLAAEFGVSVRTLRRDFRERLMYLDLEYRRGQCRLRSTGGGVQGELDALTFAHRAGLADIFPGLDRRLAGMLLTAGGMPCLVWQPPQSVSPVSSLVFYRLVSAITACQRVLLLAEGERCDGLAPYRLISFDGCWYLDERRLRKAGVDTTTFGKLAWLVPFYLWRRAKTLGQKPAYFWVWLVMLGLTVWA
ncbi:DeoR family transcriptional regulator [Salmonella enterica subsp. enterica serovar Sandiego]